MKTLILIVGFVLCVVPCQAAVDAKCVDRRDPAQKSGLVKMPKWLLFNWFSINQMWGKPAAPYPREEFPNKF